MTRIEFSPRSQLRNPRRCWLKESNVSGTGETKSAALPSTTTSQVMVVKHSFCQIPTACVNFQNSPRPSLDPRSQYPVIGRHCPRPEWCPPFPSPAEKSVYACGLHAATCPVDDLLSVGRGEQGGQSPVLRAVPYNWDLWPRDPLRQTPPWRLPQPALYFCFLPGLTMNRHRDVFSAGPTGCSRYRLSDFRCLPRFSVDTESGI